MNQIPRLKDCPFCGSDDVNYGPVDQVEAISWHCHIVCNDCEVQVQDSYTAASPEQAVTDAAEKWNARPGESEEE